MNLFQITIPEALARVFYLSIAAEKNYKRA